MDVEKLKKWFLKAKRALPWRDSPSPYEVWISEVMLQQTQASVVVNYFYRWLEAFPTVEILAASSLEKVMKVWEGLGYYSRARNLHQAARYLMEKHQGTLPSSERELSKIPGIGPYTKGAILSFAFHRKAAAIDGNVIRVISRFFCIEEDVNKTTTKEKIKQNVESLLPDEKPWVFMEGLIELGATVCKKLPLCHLCPVKQECKGREKAAFLPYKEKRITITKLTRHVAVIFYQNEILVRKEEFGKVMAGLYEFPYWEEQMKIEHLGLNLQFIKNLGKQKHSFTQFQVELIPTLWEAAEKKSIPHYEWIFLEQVNTLPFSSGHRRVLLDVLNAHFTY